MKNQLANSEYEELLKQLEQLRAERDSAKGAHAEQLKTLKKEFGCNSVEEAKRKLAKLTKRKRKLGRKAKAMYDKIVSEMGGTIDES